MKIALDVDDVLAAFSEHIANYHGKTLIKQNYWCKDTMESYFSPTWFTDVKDNPEFWDTLPVLSPAHEIDFEVACYISAFPEELRHIREAWLKKHGYPDRPLLCSYDKLPTCRAHGIDVLVDDKPATIEMLQGTEVKGLHFITPYAGFDPVGDYITSLTQVKNYI